MSTQLPHEIVDLRLDILEDENARFDERVAESIKRLEKKEVHIGGGSDEVIAAGVKRMVELGLLFDESSSRSSAKAGSWAGSGASSSGPSKEEIRSVLHVLCTYAYDNLSSFRVVAEGVDGAGNGVLQFGIDAHPEDLKGSTFEQLVERLAAYSPNKDELPRDKQAAKAEFFSGREAIGSSAGGRVDVVIGGSFPVSLTHEEWINALHNGHFSGYMPKLEPDEELPHTLPPHIMRMVKEASELEVKRDALQSYINGNDEHLSDDNRVNVRLRAEQVVAMSSYHRILKDRIANETLKHFGGES